MSTARQHRFNSIFVEPYFTSSAASIYKVLLAGCIDSKLDHVPRRNGATFCPHFVVLSALESVQDFSGDYNKRIQRHWSAFGE